MKYCSNCGEQIDEKAVICVKCGVPVNGGNVSNSQPVNNVPAQKHGAATASLTLGIIGLICGVISVIIAVGVYIFYILGSSSYVYDYSYSVSTISSIDYSVRIIICVAIGIIPGILSLIGLPLGCFCKKGGPKIAGIVLNTITLVLVIVDVILIMFA